MSDELAVLAGGTDYELAKQEIDNNVKAAWRRLLEAHPLFDNTTREKPKP